MVFVARSAGFNFPGTHLQSFGVVELNISVIRTAIYLVYFLLDEFIQHNTSLASVQNVVDDIGILDAYLTISASRTPNTAPCSSIRGIAVSLLGTTLHLAHIIVRYILRVKLLLDRFYTICG